MKHWYDGDWYEYWAGSMGLPVDVDTVPDEEWDSDYAPDPNELAFEFAVFAGSTPC